MLTEHISLFIPYHLIVNTRKIFISSHVTKALSKGKYDFRFNEEIFCFLSKSALVLLYKPDFSLIV